MMPFLRQEADTSLGDTLSNLGSQLTQAFNPLNQLRAQATAQEIQQRRFELQQQQNLDAANRNAATVYSSANPLNLNDADLAATTAQIRSGHYDPDKYIGSLKAAGGYKAAQAAVAAIDANPGDLSPQELASVKAQVLGGTSYADAMTQVQNSRLTTAKTKGVIDTANAVPAAPTPSPVPAAPAAAAAPAASPAAPTAAPAAATPPDELPGLIRNAILSGDQAQAEKLSALQRVRNANIPPGTPLGDPRVQALLNDMRIAGIAPQTGEAPTLSLQPQVTSRDVATKIAESRAALHPPGQVGSGFGYTVDANGNVTFTKPGETPPSGPGAATVNVPAAGPDTTAIASSTAAEASAKAATDYASAQLQDGISDGLAGRKVLNDVKQLRRLASLMDNTGMMTQAESNIADAAFRALGLTVTPGQTAREVFDTYKADLMASWRKDEGVQRLALPEIQLGNISLPSARMSRDALDQALDAVQAKATLGDKVGQSALKYWAKGPTAENAAAFLDERNKIYAPEANPTDTIRRGRTSGPAPKTNYISVPDPANPGRYKIVPAPAQ
jgi:hypothetical protein